MPLRQRQALMRFIFPPKSLRNSKLYSEMTKRGVGKTDLYIQSRLAGAIRHGDIDAWFQPQVNLNSGQVVGMEALARWHDPELGWIAPEIFIPMAENLGLIRELGDIIIHRAFRFFAQLAARDGAISLSVNVSKRQLFFPQFEQRLLQEAKQLGIDSHQVILEITESVAMSDVAFSRQRLSELHQQGFRIAIDDFGVGHSSLSQLHDIPIDELKIDSSFISRAHTAQGERMLQAIVAIADSLATRVVAEGVEDLRTAERLKQLGVFVVQGYAYGSPMPVDDFMRWIEGRADRTTGDDSILH